MRTLLFTLEYPPFKGGIANYYGHLAQNWPLGESITILHNNRQEIIKSGQALAWLPAIFTLWRKIKTNKIDRLLVGQILPLGTIAYILAWFKPLRYSVFLHGMDFIYALKKTRKRWLTGLILGRAERIICANSYVANQVRAFQIKLDRKIVVITPGVESLPPEISETETNILKEQYQLAGKLVIFSLGRLVKRKGVDQVIKALIGLPSAIQERLIYVVAGLGPDREYLHNLVPPNFKDKIYFLGEISEEEKWTWLNLSDIFIMPSRNISGDVEGFGIVYLEANLCAKPVIAGDSGGVRDAVIDGYSGLLIDPHNLEAIRWAIIRLVEDQPFREILGKQGRERVIKEFNWPKKAAEIVKLLS